MKILAFGYQNVLHIQKRIKNSFTTLTFLRFPLQNTARGVEQELPARQNSFSLHEPLWIEQPRMQMEPYCIDSSLTTLLRRWLSFIKAASAGSFKGLCLINLSDFNTQSPPPTHSAHSDGFLSFGGVEGRKQVDWLMVHLINSDTSTRWRLVHRQLDAALPHRQ